MKDHAERRPVVAVISFFPDFGHVQPLLKIADVLDREGFEVQCYIPQNCSPIAARFPLEFHFYPWEFDAEWRDRDKNLLKKSTFYNGFFSIVHFNLFRNSSLYQAIAGSASDLSSRLTVRRPDVILADGIFLPHFLKMIADHFGVPIVLNNSDGSLLFSRRPYVQVFGITKAPEWWMRFVEILGSLAKIHALFFRLVHFPSWVKSFRSYRSSYSSFRSVFSPGVEAARPASPIPPSRIMCGVSALEEAVIPEPRSESSPSVKDFSILPFRSKVEIDADLKDWIRASGDLPIVYVSFGSAVYISDDFVEMVFQALARLPARIIWTFPISGSGALLQKKARPDNFWISPYLPQIDILMEENVRCFVNQAGMNNIQEGILSNTPMICVPFSTDQFYNASLVDYSKIGVSISPKTLTIDQLEGAIRKVLFEGAYASKIRDVAKTCVDVDVSERIGGYFRDLVGSPAGVPDAPATDLTAV